MGFHVVSTVKDGRSVHAGVVGATATHDNNDPATDIASSASSSVLIVAVHLIQLCIA